MDFEKINAGDTLNQGRIKINNILDAAKSQVGELKSDLSQLSSEIVNVTKEVSGKIVYIDGDFSQGAISSEGIFQSTNAYICTAFIPCNIGDKIYFEDNSQIYRITEFDTDKNFVSNNDNVSELIARVNGFVRITLYTTGTTLRIIKEIYTLPIHSVDDSYSSTKWGYGVLTDRNRYKGLSLNATNTELSASGGGQVAVIATNSQKTYARIKITPKIYTNAIGGMFVGVKKSTANAEFTSGVGVYFSAGTTANTVQSANNGKRNELGNYIEQNYDLHIFVDNNIVSFHLLGDDGNEFFYKAALTLSEGEEIDLFIVSTNEARGTSGTIITGIYLPYGLLIKSESKSVMWNATDNANFRIYFPSDYDSEKTYNAIICFHGNGTNEASWSENANMIRVKNAFIEADYIVLTASYKGSNTTWGSRLSTNAYYEAYKYLLNNFNVANVGIYANSMGGIESLNALSERKIKAKCWCGTAPTYDLNNNHDNSMFTSIIENAYGVSGSNSYEVMTNGRNPAEMPNYTFGCIPMLIIGGTNDTSVNQVYNGFKLYTDVLPICEATKIEVEGEGHSFDLTNYLSNIVDFYTANMR